MTICSYLCDKQSFTAIWLQFLPQSAIQIQTITLHTEP
ncbi:hypothetical protein SHLI107390_15075 [Shewanella livingstonensis]